MRQSRPVFAAWLGGLAALLVAVVLWSATVGAADITPRAVGLIVLDRLGLATYAPAGAYHRFIVLELRLPRIALAAAVGAALSVAGTVMQGFFRNPLADPSIIGVSTGAAAGAVAVIALPATIPLGLPVAALSGGLVTAVAVYLIATRDGRTPVATLLLAGVALQTFLGAAISFMMVQSGPHGLRSAVVWLIGSLGESTWAEATTVGAATVVGLAVMGAYGRDLNVLLLGETDAHAAGVIGFVGLVVPHVMRLLIGPDHRALLPTGALAGASFLVVSDTVARAGAQEFPVGIVTAAVGAPFFLYLLRRREVYAL
jgi:iron complex transport system permease protein